MARRIIIPPPVRRRKNGLATVSHGFPRFLNFSFSLANRTRTVRSRTESYGTGTVDPQRSALPSRFPRRGDTDGIERRGIRTEDVGRTSFTVRALLRITEARRERQWGDDVNEFTCGCTSRHYRRAKKKTDRNTPSLIGRGRFRRARRRVKSRNNSTFE